MLKRLLLTTALVAAPLWAAQAGFLDIFSSLTATGGSNTYYVDSVSGNDSNTGLSPGVAWKTATPVNAKVYNAGDKVLFDGGQTFTGPVTLSAAVNYSATPPTQAQPLILDSYGTGNATIHITTTSTDALHLTNIGSITVQNLIITGSGAASQKGLRLSNTTTTTQYSDVNFNNVEVSGMSSTGMQVEADGDTSHGFTNLTFNGVNVHSSSTGSGSPGIFIAGFFPYQWTSAVYDHQNVTISNSTISGSGSDGIDMWNVNGFTVTNNRVTGNGLISTAGTTGIETQASTAGTIKFNEFDHAVLASGANSDAEGINIDRGSSNITAEYNWVHDNAGAAFAIFQDTTGIAMSGITVRYNITQNNGTAGASGNVPTEIMMGCCSGLAITGLNVYNNTFYSSSGASNVNSIVQFGAANITGNFKNNILQGTANPRSINAGTFNPTTMTFLGNDYFGTTKILWNNVSTTTIGAWGQDASAVTASPALTSPGTGGTTNGYNPGSLSAYLLANGSPATGVGQVIASPGAQDFFGHTIPNTTGTGYNIGADGSSPAAAVPAAPTISSPAQGATVSTAVATISGTGGTTGDTINITLDGVTTTSATTVSANAWTYHTGSLSNASHSVSATETNITGTSVTSGTTTFTTNVPAVPPAPVVLGPTGTVSTTVATVNGTGAANGDTITVQIDAAACSPACTTTVASNLAWSLSTSALANGQHSATAKETNATGTSPVSNTQNFTTNVVTPTTSTLDPANTTASLTLSSDHLTDTVTTATGFPQSISTTSHSTGKFHFEVQLGPTGGTATSIGIATASHNLANQVGSDTASIGVWGNNGGGAQGEVLYNGTAVIPLNANLLFAAGDLIEVEADIDAGRYWAQDVTKGTGWNGSGTANPSTGTGGASFTPGGVPWFVITSPPATLNRTNTVNFGDSNFSGPCSTNFVPWNGSATACPAAPPPGTSGTGLSAAVTLLPSDLPTTHWHTTARPWSALNIPLSTYKSRFMAQTAWVGANLDGGGCLASSWDPYGDYVGTDKETGAQIGASFAVSGDTTSLSTAIATLNCATLDYTDPNAPTQKVFPPGPINTGILYLQNAPGVPGSVLSTWESRMNVLPSGNNISNQRVVAAWGVQMGHAVGMSAYANAESLIDSWWLDQGYNLVNLQLAPFYLFQDGSSTPDTLSVEVQGRGAWLNTLYNGYSGASVAAITNAQTKASMTKMLTQGPTGDIAANGRTDNHNWVEAGEAEGYAGMAQSLNSSNPFLAGQFEHASQMGFNGISRFVNVNCCNSALFYITKNHFNPTLRVGYQNASTQEYDLENERFTALNYYVHAKGVAVTEQPSPSEIGGFAFALNSDFSTAFMNAGGTAAQINLRGDSTGSNGNFWTVTGINRIGRVGWENRLGPLDGAVEPSSQASFAPTWITSGTTWTRLGENPASCTGAFTTTFANPAVTFGKVVWTCTGSPAPVFTQNLTVTPDGVLSQTTCAGCPSTWGMTFPLMVDDGTLSPNTFGTTVMTTSVNSGGNGIASTTGYAAGDQQNYMTISSNATTMVSEANTRATVGDLMPVRAFTSDATQVSFVYPRNSSDPTAASVRSGMTITGTNTYTNSALSSSVVSGTNGTYYVGRTAAGGWATQVTSPSLIFSAPCNFIAQINGAGHVTTLEVDRVVTATVQGAPPVQMSTNVQHSF